MHAPGRRNIRHPGIGCSRNVAEQLVDGPKTAQEIAETMGVHAPSLYRLMRALATTVAADAVTQAYDFSGLQKIADMGRAMVSFSRRS
ncbi:MAG: hypothetical protein JO170_05870 [Verrucomicrobia bacterium]|nr:hypothetical protein [Verrucomicrobiota bacterium]